MQPAEWRRVRDVFDALVERRPGERERAIASSGLSADLVRELRSLLAASDESGDFLEQPPTRAPGEPALATAYRSLPAGTRIGAFALEGLIGRGGQGEVYRAIRADGHFDQVVALKLLRPEAIKKAERFRAERQILAGLDHPSIARLIDGGTAPDGRPFLAMEFVAGRSITEHCTTEGLGLEARIRLIAEVADAVAHAHRHLVVHRDLKPGNVLVATDGTVKLLDFGIARILAETEGATLTEAILTPEYAAPEQFEGRRATTATDVYALGAVLFELLTGRPPWSGGGVFSGAARLLGGEPPRASRAATERRHSTIHPNDLAGDLDAIIAKAMRTRPEDRYESAAAFAADLARHLSLHPVEARAGESAYRLRRFLLRNRGRVSAGLVTGATIAAGTLAWGLQARRTRAEQAISREENARAHAVRDYLMVMLRTAAREGGPTFGTAKQILDRTAAEIAKEIETSPGRSGLGLLRVLGELYIEMDDFEGAGPLIEQEGELAAGSGDAVGLAKARQNHAIVAIRRGRLDEAERDLAAAERIWAENPLRFAREAAEGAGIRAGLLRERGHRDAGLALLQRSLVRTRELLGPDSHEEAALRHNMGVHLLEIGRLDEAEEAMVASSTLLAAQGRSRSTIGIAVRNHLAGIAFRSGRVDDAEQMWREAIAIRRDLYGPSAALAFIQMNLVRLLIVQSRHEEALPLVEEAAEMARAFAGPDSAVTVLLRHSLALCLGLGGRADAAAREIDEALTTGRAAFGPYHMYQAFGLATRAQLGLFAGDIAAARSDLSTALNIIDGAGPAGEAHRAELMALAAMIDEAEPAQSVPVISR